jgi:hypothetical protein
MKTYEQWQCPLCKKVNQIDTEDALVKAGGHLVCLCRPGEPVRMERLTEVMARRRSDNSYL